MLPGRSYHATRRHILEDRKHPSLYCFLLISDFHVGSHSNVNRVDADEVHATSIFRVELSRVDQLVDIQKQTSFGPKRTVFWDIRPCSPLKINWRFGQFSLSPDFKLVSCSTYSSILKMGAIWYSETSLDFQRTTQCYIPEDIIVHNCCCENLKFYIDFCPTDPSTGYNLPRFSSCTSETSAKLLTFTWCKYPRPQPPSVRFLCKYSPTSKSSNTCLRKYCSVSNNIPTREQATLCACIYLCTQTTITAMQYIKRSNLA
jgi:hypothetical protein